MSDLIDRQAAINVLETTKRIASYELHGGEVLRTFNVVLNSLINIMSLLPPANNSETPNSSDCISRQAAIEALRAMQTYKLFADDDMLLIDQAGAQTELMMLPPAQPAIVPCDYAKACNEVAINRITSAVVYMEILEDFKEYGYVLVDMREVTT